MTSFLGGVEKSGGEYAEDFLITAATLYVVDMFKDKIMNPTDGWEIHLAKQAAIVSGTNWVVHLAREKGWVPNLFGS